MKKNNISLKETFQIALSNYKKKNFLATESLCKKILNIDSNHFDSLILLSNLAAINRNFKQAKDLLKRAYEIQPNNLTVLNNLGTASKELGNQKEAMSFFEKAIQINPNHTSSHYNLGVEFYKLKDFKKAKSYFQKTVNLQPNFAAAFASLANVNVELREYNEAVSNFQKAITINPKLIGAHNNLGLTFRILNDYSNAISCYKKAIELNPKHVSAHHNMALALKELGKFDEAILSHKEAIKYDPENLINYFYLSELKKDVLNNDLKKRVETNIKNEKISKKNLAYGYYLLAKYENKEKNYKKEIDYLIKGHQNYFISKGIKFKLGIKYCFEDVIQISQGAKVIKLGKKKSTNIKPIFIIGVPRCGSTLVEKIISSGTKFVPMGEETTILENFFNAKILEKKSLNLGNAQDIQNEINDLYKEKGLLLKKYENRFTDKSLNNFFYLELIKDIYPEAKIINCKRDILSSIMSIFQNNITELAWAHDIENILKYFDKYFETINSFKEIYPKFVYELEFEKLVSNPEEETKKMMSFCDLPWDRKCLEFYKRKDIISKTASNVQVRKAIYKHSASKYLPYKNFLDQYGKKYSWFK